METAEPEQQERVPPAHESFTNAKRQLVMEMQAMDQHNAFHRKLENEGQLSAY